MALPLAPLVVRRAGLGISRTVVVAIGVPVAILLFKRRSAERTERDLC